MSIIEIFNKLFMASFGLAVGGGMLALLWRRVATVRWQPLAEVYGKVNENPIAKRQMQTLIFHGVGVAFESYRGIAVVGACETGVKLSLYPPWSVFHTPLFIPFSDISVRERQWFLFTAVEITTRKVPQAKIVVYPELWDWIEIQAKANHKPDEKYYSSSTSRIFARG